MLLLSIYTWAAYYVERFTIDGTRIAIRSMFQNREFDVAELTSLCWRIYPVSGSIRFQTAERRATLDLGGYSALDRLRIIRALKELVPAERQENWPKFCFTLRDFDGEPFVLLAP